jgi:LSD1 subclass zinc finger protein
MDTNEPKIDLINHTLSCKSCGATLKFAPGTNAIQCQYCGAKNEIEIDSKASIEELDYAAYLEKGAQNEEKQTISVVKCSGCGAQTTLKPNVTSDNCAFCGTSLVIQGGSQATILRPKSLLPFNVSQKDAGELFKNWLGDLWFAPNDLTSTARNAERLKGMYIPYWTFDSDTFSEYTGERGDDYTVTETYTENGETHTRQVTRTRWSPAFGNINHDFDDVLVDATKSLPNDYVRKLEPWDLENLVPYNDQYLSGFQTETYQVNLKDGFEEAKKIMDEQIREIIRRDIGGDHQRIHTVKTKHSKITFKHILLPIWISAYRYNDQVYRFLVNGRTGEVQGERPYSWIKIALAVIAGLILVFLILKISGKV